MCHDIRTGLHRAIVGHALQVAADLGPRADVAPESIDSRPVVG